MYLCVTQIISGGVNMLPLIYSPRFDRYTYINMPYAIMIHQSSFLLTLQGYRNALRQVLGCDKSLNSPLQRGYEFWCVFVCGRQERGVDGGGEWG